MLLTSCLCETVNSDQSFWKATEQSFLVMLGFLKSTDYLSSIIALYVGVRILDGPMTDSLEAMAFNSKMHVNDIYSCR